MIPGHVVAEVRARADIVQVIGEHVPLRRAGKDFRGLCPFHQERTPSFYVVPSKGIYKCFGCGEGGDVFTFLMRRQGLSFRDAVREVAAKVGVEIREVADDRPDEAHARLYEAVAFAADFFRRQLDEGPGGEAALAYLAGRGIGRDVADRFGLGYAPEEWRALRDAALRHGIEDAVLLEAGLVKESERSAEPYDRFRGRLIFPIEDVTGRVVAFGGRVIGAARDGAPKYLNSPETPIYQKGSVLYGLSRSRNAIRRAQVALVVEGYMDYIALAAAGFEHAVAPLGTAMTEAQAALLSRYAKRAVLLYDSDTAGLRATFRSADALLRAGVHPLVATLPRGSDPDSFVRERGAAALEEAIAGAVDVLDRKLEILERRGYFRDIEGRRAALDHLLPTLRAVADPALRDIYVGRVAERTGVRRETLERERDRAEPGGRAPARSQTVRPGAVGHGEVPEDAGRRRAAAGRDSTERALLLLMLRDHERIPRVVASLDAGELRDPVYREIYEALAAGAESGEEAAGDAAATELPPWWPAWLAPAAARRLGEEARAALEVLVRDPEVFVDDDRTFEDILGEIRARSLFARLDELDRRMAGAPPEEQASLLAERTELQRQLASLSRLGFKLSRRYRLRPRRGEGDTTVPSRSKV